MPACEILGVFQEGNELWVILKTGQGTIKCKAKQIIWDKEYVKLLSNEQAICIAYRQGQLDGLAEGKLCGGLQAELEIRQAVS